MAVQQSPGILKNLQDFFFRHGPRVGRKLLRDKAWTVPEKSRAGDPVRPPFPRRLTPFHDESKNHYHA
jgi:hypothetical protein